MQTGAVACVEGYFYHGTFPNQQTKSKSIVVLTAIAFFIATDVPSLGVVNTLTGALTIITMFGVFPALMAFHYLDKSFTYALLFSFIGIIIGLVGLIPLF